MVIVYNDLFLALPPTGSSQHRSGVVMKAQSVDLHCTETFIGPQGVLFTYSSATPLVADGDGRNDGQVREIRCRGRAVPSADGTQRVLPSMTDMIAQHIPRSILTAAPADH
jgi:hypothetical protein